MQAVDHLGLARPIREGGEIVGYRAGCTCGWPGPSFRPWRAMTLTECRTNARHCAETHVERYEALEAR